MNEFAKAFKAGRDIDINFITGLENYPAALRYYVIKGFYDTIEILTTKLK
jgi:hypothetical protein